MFIKSTQDNKIINKRNSYPSLWVMGYLLIFISTTSSSASFNCTQAKTALEHQICSNRALSLADAELDMLYNLAMQSHTSVVGRNTLRQEQYTWLKQRGRCKSARCLTALYQQRNAALSQKIRSNNHYPKTLWSMIQMIGTWRVIDANQFYDSTIKLTANKKANQVHFHIQAHVGAHECDMEGEATIRSTYAVAEDDEASTNTTASPCIVLIQKTGPEQLMVTATDTCLNYYCGAGVDFTGEFHKNSPINVKSLVDSGMLPTRAYEKQFRNLVGEKDYQQFINTAMNVSNESVDYLKSGDSVHEIKVHSAYVLHAATIKCFIAYSKKGYFYAALTTFNDSNQQELIIYTNDPNNANSTPLALHNWIDEMLTDSYSQYTIRRVFKPYSVIKRQ